MVILGEDLVSRNDAIDIVNDTGVKMYFEFLY